MSDYLPTIGITMGDPSGIGPEVIVKALADPTVRRLARFVIFGFNELLSYCADLAEIEAYWWRDQHERLRPYDHDVVVLDYDEIACMGIDVKKPSKEGGAASMQFVLDAITAATARRIDAIVTAPICKESWKLAGFSRWPGHTELLAEKTRARRYAMMFAAHPSAEQTGLVSPVDGAGKAEGNRADPLLIPHHKGLRVVLCSIHEPLFELRHSFKIGAVFDPIDLADQALKDWFGIDNPRIAVCGLNPHAGENGQFGDEEQRIIEPAINMARRHGLDVRGPFSADTVFAKAVQGHYDIVVAMYHDQGLIPIKLLDFHNSVNLTLGLPIIRTSVDHGTAFDIVGKNRADPGSMKAAIRMACQIASRVHQRNARDPAH